MVAAALAVAAFGSSGAAAPTSPPPELTCAACLVAVGEDVLWARGAGTPRANASTTKMMTALLVARAAALDERVTASRNAAATGGGGLDLSRGDTFAVEDLLHALLLTSSNDAAVALAEHVAGSEAAFVARMNRFARSLGADATRFETSHGLDVAGHYSTARDLARIALAVLRRPALAEIVATPETTISGSSGTHELVNTNPLLEDYEGAVGVKTGYTASAGDVLVAAAERKGRLLIAVAMGSASAAADARALLDYGFRVLGRGILVERGSVLGALVFDPSGSAAVVAGRTVRGIPDPASVDVRFEPAGSVSLPLAEGETVGSVVVTSRGGDVVGRAPAVVDAALPDDGGGGGSVLGTILRTAASVVGARSW